MRITGKDHAKLTKTDLLAILVPDSGTPKLPTGVKLPSGVASKFEGKFRGTRFTDPTSGPAERAVLIGVGSLKGCTQEKVRRAAAIAANRAKGIRASNLTIWVDERVAKAVGAESAGQAAAEGARMACYSINKWKSKKPTSEVKSIAICGPGAPFKRGVKTGTAIGEANCFTRFLQDSPGNLARPRDLVSASKTIAKRSTRVTATALTEAQMKKLGMNSLLSVSQGSVEPAYLIHMVYKPKVKAKKKIAFVGKGLTFDAGGISLKPSAKMEEMKYDMSGGAAVLGIMHALCDLDVPYEVHGFVPTSENMPDADATKPGDVFKAYNGKTIEVINTDAEGRLILADALGYCSKKVKPDVIVDMATLTGAIIVSLGHEVSGLFSNDDTLANKLIAAGDASSEGVWRMPILDVYSRQLRGSVSDLRNINSGQGGGSGVAAAFLSEFVGDGIDWAHLDIAGAAWNTEQRDYQGGRMGTGVGVRLLVEYLRHHA